MLTEDFVQYSHGEHQKAQGSQNAQLQVDFQVEASSSISIAQASSLAQQQQAAAKDAAPGECWRFSEIASSGLHSEKSIIDKFKEKLRNFQHSRAQREKLIVTRVQLLSRFNPCPDCTGLLIDFKRYIKGNLALATATVFEIGYRGNLWIPDANNTLHGKQISIDAAQIQLSESVARLMVDEWKWVGNIMSLTDPYYKDRYRPRAAGAARKINGILLDNDVLTQVDFGWDQWTGSYANWLYVRLQSVENWLSKDQKDAIYRDYGP